MNGVRKLYTFVGVLILIQLIKGSDICESKASLRIGSKTLSLSEMVGEKKLVYQNFTRTKYSEKVVVTMVKNTQHVNKCRGTIIIGWPAGDCTWSERPVIYNNELFSEVKSLNKCKGFKTCLGNCDGFSRTECDDLESGSSWTPANVFVRPQISKNVIDSQCTIVYECVIKTFSSIVYAVDDEKIMIEDPLLNIIRLEPDQNLQFVSGYYYKIEKITRDIDIVTLKCIKSQVQTECFDKEANEIIKLIGKEMFSKNFVYVLKGEAVVQNLIHPSFEKSESYAKVGDLERIYDHLVFENMDTTYNYQLLEKRYLKLTNLVKSLVYWSLNITDTPLSLLLNHDVIGTNCSTENIISLLVTKAYNPKKDSDDHIEADLFDIGALDVTDFGTLSFDANSFLRDRMHELSVRKMKEGKAFSNNGFSMLVFDIKDSIVNFFASVQTGIFWLASIITFVLAYKSIRVS